MTVTGHHRPARVRTFRYSCYLVIPIACLLTPIYSEVVVVLEALILETKP